MFCSTDSPTARHLIPPGPATRDALCRPGKVGAGTADGSATMANGSVATTRWGHRWQVPPVRPLAIEPFSAGDVVAAAAKTAVFGARFGDDAAVPSSSVLEQESSMHLDDLGSIWGGKPKSRKSRYEKNCTP